MAEESFILTVMVGNAATSFGLFQDSGLVASWQLSTPEHMTADEARLQLRSSFRQFAADAVGTGAASFPLKAILGSVVPGLTDAWKRALEAETGRRPLVVGPRLKTGISIACKNPSEVGADRVADAVAARLRANGAAIVVHFEAATTITAVDANGSLAGGVILPGFQHSPDVLARLAARLPQVEVAAPKHVIGKTTQEAIASGVVWGEVARIDGLVEMVRRELADGAGAAIGTIPVFATGEHAALLAPLLRCQPVVQPALTLEGLAHIAQNAR